MIKRKLLTASLLAAMVLSTVPVVNAGAAEKQPAYVMMNIPYSEFYAAENAGEVDTVSSATLTKTRSSLANGTYHVNSDGSDITGVTYPVKVSDLSVLKGLKQVTDSDSYSITVSLRGKETTTEYSGVNALFENDSHAYYVLSETPSYYKELTVNKDGSFSFSKAKGTTTNEKYSATLYSGSETKYGDYELDMPDDFSAETVYGAVVHTKEGAGYGMKAIENIWKNQKIAFSTGHTTESHGSPLQVYNGPEGQTVTGITFYTNKGIENVTLNESEYLAPVADFSAAAVDSQTIRVTGLPSDIKEAKASVSYTTGSGRDSVTTNVAENADVTDGQIKTGTALTEGTTYTVNISSKNYSASSASFTYSSSAAAETVSAKVGNATYIITSADNRTVKFAGTTSTKTSVTIPASVKINGTSYKVTEVGLSAFTGNGKIKSVTLGKNITRIGNRAFYGCKKLAKITVNSKLSYVPTDAFSGCKSLKQVVLKKSSKTNKALLKTAFSAAALKGIKYTA
ncbi:MAG: leucine-rich repeat domain-containing protein [Candidatus Weimeria sp.]